MSKIKELLRDQNTVLAFDMDGVLALMEFGEYNHFDMTEEAWQEASLTDENFYTDDKVIKKMQDYLATRNMDNIYVISKRYTPNEEKSKVSFLVKNYKIKKENIYFVEKNIEKIDVLKQIKELHSEIEDYQLGMVEDTVEVLDNVRDKTGFSTIHISSFIDL